MEKKIHFLLQELHCRQHRSKDPVFFGFFGRVESAFSTTRRETISWISSREIFLAHDFVEEFCGSGALISCLDEGANMVANAVCIVQIASAILGEGELALLEKVVYSHQMLNQCRSDQSSREVLCVVYLVQTATD